MKTKHRLEKTTALEAIVVFVAIAAATPVLAQNPQQDGVSSDRPPQTNLRSYVPDTVSEGWRQVFEAFPDPTKAAPCPGPNDLEGWRNFYDAK